MGALLKKLPAICLGAAALSIPVHTYAAAITVDEESERLVVGDNIAAFFVVCLMNYGDPEGQIAAAEFQYEQTDKVYWRLLDKQAEGSITSATFQGFRLQVEEGGNHACSFSVATVDPITVETLGEELSGIVGGLSATYQTQPEPRAVWILEVPGNAEGPILLSATSAPQGDGSLVTFSVKDFGG